MSKHAPCSLGRAVVHLILEKVRNVLGLHGIDLEVFAFNPRAICALKKLRFKGEGIRYEVLFTDGKYHDAIVIGLLQHEYTT